MPEITTTAFKPWHVKLIKTGEHYGSVHMNPEMRAYLHRQVEGITLLIDGEIAAILGVVPLWPGVGEVTMIPSSVFYQNLKTCVKFTRNTIALAAETFNMHRIQATTLTSNPKHGRFMEAMGFTHEGRLRGYGPNGEDFEMYSYTR